MGFVNGLNKYLYCFNNPINFVDPYGLDVAPIMGVPDVFNPGQISNTGTYDNESGNYNFVMPPMQNPFGGGGNDTSGLPDFGPIHAPDLGGKETNPNTINDNGDVFSASGDNNPNNLESPFGDPNEWQTNTGEPWVPDNLNKDTLDNVRLGTEKWKVWLYYILKFISKFMSPTQYFH